MFPRHFRLLAIPFVLGLVGCGSGDEISSYTLLPVSGTVTHNGKPMEGAEISFIPAGDNNPSTAASDKTGPEGQYMMMFHGRSGLAAGKYQVIIKKTILPEGASTQALPGDIAEDPEMARLARGSASRKKGGAVVATVIEETQQTEVTPETAILDFNVKSSAKPAS